MKQCNCYTFSNRRMFISICAIIIVVDMLDLNQGVWAYKNMTTCEEFETGALFDPYDAVDSMWKIFYFWSNTSEINPIIFSLPTKKRLKKVKEVLDTIDNNMNVEWHRVTLLMEPRPGVMVLLMQAGSPGAFRALVKQEQRNKVRPNPEPLIKFADIRMKTEGRYIGMMCCEDLTAFALARVEEMPKTEQDCESAAATLGLRGPGGRSYFYFSKKQTSEEL